MRKESWQTEPSPSRIQRDAGMWAKAHFHPSTECGLKKWTGGRAPGLLQGRHMEVLRRTECFSFPASRTELCLAPGASGTRFAEDFPGNKCNYCSEWVRLALLSEQHLLWKFPRGGWGAWECLHLSQKKVNGYWLDCKKHWFLDLGRNCHNLSFSPCLLYWAKELHDLRFLVYQRHWGH